MLICSPAVARSACRSPRPDGRCTPSSASRPCSRRSNRRRAAPGWLPALRPSAAICTRAARGRRTRALRCAGGGSPVGAPGRRLKRSPHRRWRALQWSPATRRRSRAMLDSDRRRLPVPVGAADRRLPVVQSARAGRRLCAPGPKVKTATACGERSGGLMPRHPPGGLAPALICCTSAFARRGPHVPFV